MQLLPIPPTLEHLGSLRPLWGPFLLRVAQRSGRSFTDLSAEVMSGEVIVCLVWDEEAKEAKAAGGIRPLVRGEDRVAEIEWLTGRDMKMWLGLSEQFEKFISAPPEEGGLGCQIIKWVGRQGWVKVLKNHDFRVSRVVMEKRINGRN
jgi:hypothetical protein